MTDQYVTAAMLRDMRHDVFADILTRILGELAADAAEIRATGHDPRYGVHYDERRDAYVFAVEPEPRPALFTDWFQPTAPQRLAPDVTTPITVADLDRVMRQMRRNRTYRDAYWAQWVADRNRLGPEPAAPPPRTFRSAW